MVKEPAHRAMDYATICRSLAVHGLAVVGAVSATGSDEQLPDQAQTLLLVGADGDAMWPVFAASPEGADGAPDPLDRWSRRIIDRVAHELSAQAHYPFGGPPYAPFLRWAQLAENAQPSPICMLVSPTRGLWTSYRGALSFTVDIAVPVGVAEQPCDGCPQPCLSACPVDAFAGSAYNVRACLEHLDSPAGGSCADGCLARHACPVGTPPPSAQRRFHMASFVASGRHRA